MCVEGGKSSGEREECSEPGKNERSGLEVKDRSASGCWKTVSMVGTLQEGAG